LTIPDSGKVSAETFRYLVADHLRGCRFAEARAAWQVLGDPRSPEAGPIEALTLFGRRLLRLDLEDIALDDRPELARHLDPDLAALGRRLNFPRRATDPDRGPLGHPLELVSQLLESLRVRWERSEILHVMALIHLLGEYLGHLAWSGVLGDGADPMSLPDHVRGSHSLWGDLEDRRCGHGRAQKKLALRILRAEPAHSDRSWVQFLRRDYSRIGDLLSVCATRDSGRAWKGRVRNCDAPCSVWTRLDQGRQLELEQKMEIVRWYTRSPLLQLRHSAPVGHFFGVPTRDEIEEQWDVMADRMATRLDVDLGEGGVPPQAARLCGLVAGTDITPGRNLERVGSLLGELMLGISPGDSSVSPAHP